MEKINIKSKILLVLALFVMASCLEDKGYLDIFNGENATPVVSFGQADYGAATGTVVRTVEVSETSQPITLSVNVARATSDVTVTIGVDPTLVDAYNAEHGTDYVLLPDSTYSLPVTSITVPAGTLDGNFSFEVVSSKVSLDYAYLLPLVITNSSEGTIVASNLNKALVAVTVKNIYDGIYEVRGGTMTRNSATGPDPVLGGAYKTSGIFIPMSTLSANSVAFQPTWRDGSAVGGIDNTYLIVDPATNEVTVLSAGNATLKNTVGRTNSYDPATRTFTLNFDWGNAPSTRIIEDLQLVWIGPRD